jgi:hypothetical protein
MHLRFSELERFLQPGYNGTVSISDLELSSTVCPKEQIKISKVDSKIIFFI